MGDVDYLYEPEGHELHWDGLKKAQEKPSVQHASLSGPAPSYVHPHDRQGMGGTSAAQAMKQAPPVRADRQMTPDELIKHANELIDQNAAQHSASLSNGPSVGQRDANGKPLPSWLTQYMEHENER